MANNLLNRGGTKEHGRADQSRTPDSARSLDGLRAGNSPRRYVRRVWPPEYRSRHRLESKEEHPVTKGVGVGTKMGWTRRLIAGLMAVTCTACAAPLRRTVKPPAPTPGPAMVQSVPKLGRPAVGVAFGGGSARGIAHIGVIRWMEEHRIPIDVAAGTSMGGLVGGAYASGMDAAELQTFIEGLNWDQLFGASNFAHRNI